MSASCMTPRPLWSNCEPSDTKRRAVQTPVGRLTAEKRSSMPMPRWQFDTGTDPAWYTIGSPAVPPSQSPRDTMLFEPARTRAAARHRLDAARARAAIVASSKRSKRTQGPTAPGPGIRSMKGKIPTPHKSIYLRVRVCCGAMWVPAAAGAVSLRINAPDLIDASTSPTCPTDTGEVVPSLLPGRGGHPAHVNGG
jgi:hypothetical protein